MDREHRLRAAEQDLWRSLDVEPSERRIDLPRLGVRVRVQVVGSGPPALFVHGASAWGTSWADLAARLPNRTCLLLDRPGTGLSDPLAGRVRTVDDLVEVADRLVPDVLDALELDRADLVTSSFGGYFGLQGTLAAPDRIGRIVELGWSAGAAVGRMPLVMRLGSTPPLGRILARMPANEATVRRLLGSIGLREALDAGRVSDEAIRAYAAMLNETDTMQHELDLGGLFLSGVSSGDPRLVLPVEVRATIAQPLLVVWGDRDPFGSVEVARAFVAAFPNARLELQAGVGHAPWMDDAPRTAGLVEAFLAAA